MWRELLWQGVFFLALETQNYTFDKNPTEITTYMSLQEFSFNINFYETSLEHGTKPAYGEIYIFSKTNFIDVYINKTTTAILFFSLTLKPIS